MEEKKANYTSLILFVLALVIATPIITVLTREAELSFDPVLLFWSALILVYTLVQYRSLIPALLSSLPLLLFSVLPAVGFPEIQDNPNNPNLLHIHYYYLAGGFLVIATGLISRVHKSEF
ncbi:MAG: hypothetical protein LAT84_02500 [Balneolia bacterium]|nr:hypothetical protein [Balneolia bacterium]